MTSENAREKRADHLVGELLASRYLIEAKIGEGAMGAVYRSRHVKVGRAFAVKVLHKRLLQEKKIALRFEREAELAGRLRHPNVIGVVDVGETPDGLRYMVMDFAEGSDLAELLDEAPMPAERIIHLVRQMLDGLHHAHEAGLIHRDFKPENVIVERDDNGLEVPRIVDFGISILRDGGDSTDSEGRLTTNGLVLGTPHYMAPEQAVADPIDHRIDLFAMGIVIYEMLSGMLPFDGNGAEVARANLLLDPPTIAQRVPYLEVDPLLEAFARRLMAKKRDHRPATAKKARELLDLIERDRAAAAAALGIPPDIATRAPQLTQPVNQQRPPAAPAAPATTTETAPSKPLPSPGAAPIAAPAPAPAPAAAAPVAVTPRPSDFEAPPIQHAHTAAAAESATPTGPPAAASKQYAVTTSVTDPLPWGDESPRRSNRWIYLGGGLVAVGAIVAIVLASSAGGGGEKQPAANKVAMAPSGADPQPPQPPPGPDPKQPDPKQPDPPGSVTATPITDPDAAPTKLEPDPAKSTPAKIDRSTRPTKVTPTKPDPVKPDPVKLEPTKPDPVKPDPVKLEPTKPDPVKPDPEKPKPPTSTGPITSADGLQLEWRAVRAEITALEKSHGAAAIDRPFTRFRMINIGASMTNPQKIASTAAELAEIRKLIAAARAQKP